MVDHEPMGVLDGGFAHDETLAGLDALALNI